MDYPCNLGLYTRKVTTSSAEARRWFDRGLNWCFGYHHEEAVACFEKALERDPNCAMARWGIAYAVGPNYNFPWELQEPAGKAAALPRAYDSTRATLALVAHNEVVGMLVVCEPHGVGKGVIPGALVVDGITLRIASRQRLDQRAFRRAGISKPTTAAFVHCRARAPEVSVKKRRYQISRESDHPGL